MPGRGRAKGRGKGRGRQQESEEDRINREENERKEQKKYKLIELVKEHPCLFDTAHPEHLNKGITSVLWQEILAVLDEDGESKYLLTFIRNSIRLDNNNNMQNSMYKHSLQ